MPQDRRFMWRALELAKRGQPYVAPNPMVGAVIVRDGQVVGEGYHEEFGAAHAEVNALKQAGDKAAGATMYVTLEPCCATYEGKKTPPCVPALIAAGLKRVVIAMEDPHAQVKGLGVRQLAQAGIDVHVGECIEEARELNAPYITHTEKGRPLVTAKWAMTMDGKIATRTGDARWISSEESRKEVHYDRGCTGALIVGRGTVERDNPRLTARGGIGRQPLRVVIDADLLLPMDCELVKSAKLAPVFIYCAEDAPEARQEALEQAGVYLILLERHNNHLRWHEILRDLGERGVTSAIIEGGGGLFATAFQERAIDRVKIFIAPKIFGGESATTPVEGPGVPDVERAIQFDHLRTRTIGPDIVIEGRAVYPDKTGPSPSGYWKGYEGR
ncbi:MAG: bifunctional diaminohydroxyphosphoribosylaminopyrimidine deaminase/5-amino-6-(5-phosphoribosylamino)uracil reductase RibD [Planctomycetes bacterium]|nr:bifunctional diaminohydroxyphosphoribosylaminopyrimidine deaminase/5-amino-6-(5-phosphoribosylamino)uracil reductase RibD [Planctomycetota bacterium]MCW8135677.1 bifunctional diaminohydroxyphosphoribosylaminopyrimidine deaminase/5-amino-6-(5-phosphoribosylamino)uracil reductase RibD [Planctomycetota bacterium]